MEILEVLEEIITCKEYPTAVADGYMCDFYGKKKDDVLMSEGMKCKTLEKPIFTSLRNYASSCRRLNVLNRSMVRRRKFICNELVYKEVATYLQNKYFDYFAVKYPNCKFYTRKMWYPIAVRKDNKLVGLIMPLNFNRQGF
jgi:hypothetical protein